MNAHSFLSSPAGKNLTSAAIAGVVTYLRPARVPTWARRSLLATNTAGTGTAMLLGTDAKAGSAAPLAGKLGSKAGPVEGIAGALTAVTAGVGLLTSKPGLKLDAKVEQMLLNRGVRRPRLLMAVGAVGVVYVIGVVTERAAQAAEKKAAELQNDERAQLPRTS